MRGILINTVLLLFLFYFYQRTRHGLHILQLENYYNSRYFAWMKKYKHRLFFPRMLLVLIFVPAFAFFLKLYEVGLGIMILDYIVLIAAFPKKKEKKPFVVTSRIKRMYVTYLILFAIAFYFANTGKYRITLNILNVCAVIVYAFVYIINFVNRPIEMFIRRNFCKKAHDKLKDMPDLKVVGITGSYGKTSTKYIINTILSQKYNTLMTPESYNTTMGVVRTINEKLTSTHQVFVCEMGAKYVGDIKEICKIVEPTYGVLTAIGPQHLDTFKGLENVKRTKLELVDSLPEENGLAFLNWEDENIRNCEISKNAIKFGLTPESDYYAENIEITERGSSFDVIIPGKNKIAIKTRLLGELNILNIVGAVAIADKLGLTEDEIKIGIKYIRPVPHRLELKQNPNGSIIIDDAYNSNIRGAKMALDVLKTFEDRERICITPGIVELGDKSEEINKELGEKIAESSDFVILVGAKQTIPIFEGIQEKEFDLDNVYIAKNLDQALSKMNEIITENSVVLLENDLPDNYL